MSAKRARRSRPERPTALTLAGDAPHPEEVALSILDRAQNGDESVVDELRDLLERSSAEGGLEVTLQSSLAAAIEADSGTNLLAREAAFLLVRRWKGRLAGPHPSPLEEMLVDHVITSWWYLREAEIRNLNASQREGGISLRLGDFLQRQVSVCQRRYLAAVRMLADVRRMQLPEVTIQSPSQVNIGNQQLNVASTVTEPASGEPEHPTEGQA